MQQPPISKAFPYIQVIQLFRSHLYYSQCAQPATALNVISLIHIALNAMITIVFIMVPAIKAKVPIVNGKLSYMKI
jgi:hypothetical protein